MTKSSLSNRRFIQTSILNSPQLFFVSLFWKSYNLSLYQFLLFFLSFLIFGSHRTNRYKLPITTCISSWITFLWFHEFQTCDQGNGSCFHIFITEFHFDSTLSSIHCCNTLDERWSKNRWMHIGLERKNVNERWVHVLILLVLSGCHRFISYYFPHLTNSVTTCPKWK